MISMTLEGVRVETPTNQPIVLLRETEGSRFLPIFIGIREAEAIVFGTQGIVTKRPLTHDLLRDVLGELGFSLVRVVITELRENTFYANLELERNGEAHVVSARPSDAIALAVRTQTPLFAESAVLEEAGVEFEADAEEEEDEVEKFRNFLDSVTPEDFAS